MLGAPPAGLETGQEERFELVEGAAQHKAQILELAVIGKDLHQHLQVGDEVHRFEREPLLRNLRARIRNA